MTAPATWYVVAGNNDTSWRVDIPAAAIGAKVVKINQDRGRYDLAHPNLTGDFRWTITEEGEAFYPDQEGDSAVWTRPDGPRAAHALAMYEKGVRIVAEVDDNYLADPKFNLFMRRHYGASTRDEIKRAFAPFDHIIVTTPRLRDYFRKGLKQYGVKPLPEFHVCGNHIDPDRWPVRPAYEGPVRVGWMGSDSHWRDIRLGYTAFKLAADLGCHVHFIGYDPKWRPDQVAAANRNKGNLEGFEYEHTEWIDPRQWDRQQAYPLDIAIAPLERNAFTLGKSDVKVLEYGMSGAAVVCSDTIYGQTIIHGETGLIGNSPMEIARHTHTLIQNPRLRAELVQNLQQYIKENRLISQHTAEWEEAVLGCRSTSSTQNPPKVAALSSG